MIIHTTLPRYERELAPPRARFFHRVLGSVGVAMVWVAAQHGDGVSEGLEPGVSTAIARTPVRLRLAERLYANWYSE
jgi:hypothetical protein